MQPDQAIINSRVYITHLEPTHPDVTNEPNVLHGVLYNRKARLTGLLRTWLKGQKDRVIWVHLDRPSNFHLTPFHLTELDPVANCNCVGINLTTERTGWTCDYHGVVRKGASTTALCQQLERNGCVRLVPATPTGRPTATEIRNMSTSVLNELLEHYLQPFFQKQSLGTHRRYYATNRVDASDAKTALRMLNLKLFFGEFETGCAAAFSTRINSETQFQTVCEPSEEFAVARAAAITITKLADHGDETFNL